MKVSTNEKKSAIYIKDVAEDNKAAVIAALEESGLASKVKETKQGDIGVAELTTDADGNINIDAVIAEIENIANSVVVPVPEIEDETVDTAEQAVSTPIIKEYRKINDTDAVRKSIAEGNKVKLEVIRRNKFNNIVGSVNQKNLAAEIATSLTDMGNNFNAGLEFYTSSTYTDKTSGEEKTKVTKGTIYEIDALHDEENPENSRKRQIVIKVDNGEQPYRFSRPIERYTAENAPKPELVGNVTFASVGEAIRHEASPIKFAKTVNLKMVEYKDTTHEYNKNLIEAIAEASDKLDEGAVLVKVTYEKGKTPIVEQSKQNLPEPEVDTLELN